MAGNRYLHCPEGWTIKSLIDCTEDMTISYGIVQPGSYVEDGIPIARVNNFTDGTLDISNALRVAPTIEEKHSRTRLQGGEVLLTLVGSTGQSTIAPESLRGWNVARAIAVIRAEKGIGARWINICLQSQATKSFLDAHANTTVQKTLNLKDVRQIPILIPPKRTKNFIEALISSLDEKIELNRQMNTTLEAMAQALFKSWFVDFDPVIDNALAAGNPIPEALQAKAAVRQALGDKRKPLPETIRQQFPSSFVFTEEMGWVPEGWIPCNLGEIAIFKNGKKSPERTSGTIPVYGSNGLIGVCKDFNRENVIIVGRVGTYCGSLFFCSSTCWVTDNAMTAVMVKPSNNLFLFELLNRADLNNRRGGSGQPLLNQSILSTIRITKPSENLIAEYSRISSSFHDSTSFNKGSIDILSKLRDTLLPKLLSGELRIPEAEKLVASTL